MKRKILSVTLCLGMAVSMLAGCGSASSGSAAADSSSDTSTATESAGTAVSGDAFILGTVLNTTGAMADYEAPAANGIQLAVDEINAAGGIAGKQIDYEMINAQSDASQNSTAVTKLIDMGAPVIIGEAESTLATTAGSVAQEAGVPFVTYGATLPDLPDRVGDCFFLSCYSDKVQADAMAEYAYNELAAKTAYVIKDTTSEYTEALSDNFISKFEELGGTIVLEDSYDENGNTDFSANIAKLTALTEQPDVLYFASFSDQAPTMLTQYRGQGLEMPILSGDGFDATSIPEVAGDDANNVYYTTHVDVTSTDESYLNFVANYKEAFGTDPENAFAALGYDTVYLVKEAVESIDGDITPDTIKEAIGQISGFKGLTGEISYSNGSHVPDKSVVVNKFEDGAVVNVTTIAP